MNRKIIWILFSICIIFVLSAFTINPSTSSINLSTAKDDVVVVNYEMDKVNSEGALSLQLLLNSYGKNLEIARSAIIAADKNFNEELPITGTKIEGNKIIYTLESDEQVSKIYIKSPVVYLADEITPVSLSLNASLLYSKDIQAKTTTLQDVKNSWFSVNSVNVEEKEEDGQTIKNLIVSITPFNSELPRLPKLVVGNTEYFGNTVHSFDENFNFTSAKFIFSLPEECYNDLESILNNSKLIIKDALFKLSDMQESSNPFDISLEVKR